MLGYGPTSDLQETLVSAGFDFSPQLSMETALSITQYIEKCFAVIIFAKVDPVLASTSGFIEEKFGLTSELIERIEPFPIGNPNICVIFVCMRESNWVPHVIQKYGSRYPGIRLRPASELLLNAARKKEQIPNVTSPEVAFHMLYRPPPPRIPVVSFNHRMPMRPMMASTVPQQTFSLSKVPNVPVIRPRMAPVIRRPTMSTIPSRGPAPPVLVPRHVFRQPPQTSQPSSGNSDIFPSTSQQLPLSAPPLHQNPPNFEQNLNSSLGTYGSIASTMPFSASQPNLNSSQGIFPPFANNTSYPPSSGGYH